MSALTWGVGVFMALGVLGACASASTPVSGLVAYFPFEGDATDQGASRFTTSVNGDLTFVPGYPGLGRCARFNGSDAWVFVNHGGPLTFDPFTQPFSVSLWARIDPNEDSGDFLHERWGGANKTSVYGFGPLSSSDAIVASTDFYTQSQGHIGFNAVSGGLSDVRGGWHHFAFTVEPRPASGGVPAGAIKKLYVDGQLRGEAQIDLRPYEPAAPGLVIGARQGWSGGADGIANFFHGQLDELRIYDRALSQGEIRSLSKPHVAYFSFEGTPADQGPSSFPTATAGDLTFVPSYPGLGQSARFNGSDAWIFVDHGGPLTFDPFTHPFSVSLWARIDPNEDSGDFLHERWGGANKTAVYAFGMRSPDTIEAATAFYTRSQGHVGFNAGAVGLTEVRGGWHHFGFTVQPRPAGAGAPAGAIKKLYVDGLLRGEAQIDVRAYEASAPGLVIGARQGWSGGADGIANFFHGQLDELRVYDRVLSDDDMVQLATVCRADVNQDGLVDFADYLEFLNLYAMQDAGADYNQDGIVDFADYLEFLNAHDAGC